MPTDAPIADQFADVYSYKPEDIVILIDDDDINQKQPTRANIVEEMQNLVKDAEENDRFFFHCERPCGLLRGSMANVVQLLVIPTKKIQTTLKKKMAKTNVSRAAVPRV